MNRLALLALCPMLLPAAYADNATADLKAALLYRFVQYSDWAADAPAGHNYCIAGDAEVFNALGRMLPQAQQHVRFLDNAAQAAQCSVLYLSAELTRQAGWAQLLRQPSCLTVVEGAELFRQGAIFGLIAEPKRISFRVNLTLAREYGFDLSAQMLKLAKEIH